jgi:hypothetical protein
LACNFGNEIRHEDAPFDQHIIIRAGKACRDL